MRETLAEAIERHRREKREYEDKIGITHRVPGVWWYEAPLPPFLHRCRPWTIAPGLRGRRDYGVERCACGGMRFTDDRRAGWGWRNSRGRWWYTRRFALRKRRLP